MKKGLIDWIEGYRQGFMTLLEDMEDKIQAIRSHADSKKSR